MCGKFLRCRCIFPPCLATNRFPLNIMQAIEGCKFCQYLFNPLPVDAVARAHLPLAMGGLGLMSATHLAAPAYWVSWADAMPVLQQQTPAVAETILQLFADPAQAPPHIQAAQAARQAIQEQGWDPPHLATIPGNTAATPSSRTFRGADTARVATTGCNPFQLDSPGGALQHLGPSKPSDA